MTEAAVHLEDTPCPACGYDLRGHAARTRCPECGEEVCSSDAAREVNRWVDHRLIDLWSIGLFQTLGLVALGITLLTLRRGEYVAVLTGILAAAYLAAGAVWLVAVMVSAGLRRLRPIHRSITASRRRRLRWWLAMNLVLLGIAAAMTVWMMA
jgi:predicted RNA-binding Zn-ribbon protein involved in translation (DUF1610 family)